MITDLQVLRTATQNIRFLACKHIPDVYRGGCFYVMLFGFNYFLKPKYDFFQYVKSVVTLKC